MELQSLRALMEEQKASPMRYRLYVDEVGNSCLRSAVNIRNQQYLSLTGVVLGLDYHDGPFTDELNRMKRRFFGSDTYVLHRRELQSGAPPFQSLARPERRVEFNEELLSLIRRTDFAVMTVLIDKRAHIERYRIWQKHPYHYCMECLLERYETVLQGRRSVGDLLVEARGQYDDKPLKKAYQFFYQHGTAFRDAAALQAVLTSCELKLKPKSDNVPGLQLADLLANPCSRFLQCQVERERMTSQFGNEIVRVLRYKHWVTKTLP